MGARQCVGVFIIGDQHSPNPSEEDALSIMWTIVVRKNLLHVNDDLSIVVQVVLPQNKKHAR